MATGTMVGARLTTKQLRMLERIREDLCDGWPVGTQPPSLSDTVRTLIHAEHERLVGEEAHAAFMAEKDE